MTRSIPFDQIADRYDESRGGESRAHWMAEGLAPYLDPTRTVAEIGIGTGIIAAELERRGHRVVGVDLAPAMLHKANQRLPGQVAVGDPARLPMPSAVFASAYLVWVLHVVADPAAVVREAARIIEPGGRLIIVPAHSFPDPDDEMEATYSVLQVLRPRHHMVDDVEGWLVAAGVSRIEISSVEDSSMASPAEAAREIEQRTWSSLWDVDEDTWASLVQPVIDALMALDDPEVPRRRRHRNHVIVGHFDG